MPSRTAAVLVMAASAAVMLPLTARAEREYDFAKALWQRGFQDLAVAQYRKVLKLRSATAEVKSQAHFDLASILQEMADQAAAGDRQALLGQAQAELAGALKGAGTNVVLVFAARQQQALLLQNNGLYLANLLTRGDFVGSRPETKTEALKAYDDSVAAFEALSKDAQALVARVEKERKPGYEKVSQGLRNEQVNALLRALWSRYYAALVFGKDEAGRKERLDQAAQGFAAFGKDWDGFLISLYGHLGEGLCALEAGDHKKAQAKFALVLTQRELKPARDVCVQALIYRATSFNATDQASAATEDLNAALSFFTVPERVELGRQALLEKAKALEQVAGQLRAAKPDSTEWKSLLRQALTAARAVSKSAGPYTDQAIAQVTRLLEALGMNEAASTPGEALAVAEAALQQKKYDVARDAYRQAIDLSKDPHAPAVARGWFGLARCFYSVKAYAEAAIIFEYVGESFSGTAEGPRAAYLAVQCWNLAYSESKSAADLHASARSLDGALKRYGGNAQVAELRALAGRLLVAEGRYEEALKAFDAVKAGTPGYALAQYESGMCAWEWFMNLLRRGRLGEDKGQTQCDAAVAHLKTFLGLAKDVTAPEDRLRAGNARMVLATIYGDLLGDAKAAFAFIEGFDFPEELKGRVLPLRLKGLIQAQRVDEALALLKEARDTSKAQPERFQEVLQLIAQVLDEQAQALREKGNPAEYQAAAKRTADFLLGVIRDNPEQDLEMYQFVASRLKNFGRSKEASDVLNQLIARAGTDAKQESVVLWARQTLVECLMDEKSWSAAIENLKALQVKYPASARLRALLGACYLESGRPNDGIPLLEELFKKTYKPGTRPWFEVGLTLGRSYEKAGRPADVLKVTSYVQVLYPEFWKGRDADHADLSDKYQELHKRCGGTE